MIGPSGNPFEPPAPDGELSIDPSPMLAGEVTSVTFRISIEDLKRASSIGFAPIAMTGVVVVLAMIGVYQAVWPSIRFQGWTKDSVRLLAFSVLPMLLAVGVILVIHVRKQGRMPLEAPFETRVILSPSELIIREVGIAELRRSWSSVAAVSHNRHQIRFDLFMFDPNGGRFVVQPGPIVPLRAFESESEAASFLSTARRLIDAAEALPQEPGASRHP